MTFESAVVVGSGLGGLAAAIRLRSLGYRVTVLEALDQPGGRARVFRRDGYTFDAGPTVITAPHLLDELFRRVGRNPREYFELVPVDPFYRIVFHDGSRFDYHGDEDRLLTEIERLSPADVDGYRRLATEARRIFDIGYTELADRPFDRLRTMLRTLPAMARLRSDRSVYDLVSRHIQDERLRRAFSFEPLLVGGHPFRTSSIYQLIHWLERKWGVHYVRGGTTALVSAMTRLLEELGVEVRLSSPVQEILVRERRGGRRAEGVVTEGGERIASDLVVANADPARVWTDLIADRHQPLTLRLKRRRMRSSMGLFVGYFGSRRTYPDLCHHTILLGPRYRGLLDDIFRRRVLADDFSLYLHAPTRTDPSMAPPGRDAFYVLSPVPNNRSGIDWERERERYFDRILASLEERLLPALGSAVETRFSLTPLEFERDLRSADGSAFGPEPVLTQSAWFRWHNRNRSIGGLYFVGAGVHPGAGVPGVLNSAKLLECVVPRPESSGPRTEAGDLVLARGSRYDYA